MQHTVKITHIEKITHNVRRYVIEKPEGYTFEPGQATDLSIAEEAWKNKKRPFTFTCLNSDPYLEFTIKSYNDHDGVTHRLGQLKVGDKLIIRDAWGAIQYKGPGYFIAGGAGITPFIAIIRQLNLDGKLKGNKLFFSNQKDNDIILRDELAARLDADVIFTTTKQQDAEHDHRRIDKAFLQAEVTDFKKHFYICGPDPMIKEISGILEELGTKTDAVVFER